MTGKRGRPHTRHIVVFDDTRTKLVVGVRFPYSCRICGMPFTTPFHYQDESHRVELPVPQTLSTSVRPIPLPIWEESED